LEGALESKCQQRRFEENCGEVEVNGRGKDVLASS
jgi:hypothetical protein